MFTALWQERQSGLDSLYRDLADHFAPLRARFVLATSTATDWRSPKIIDSTGVRSADTFAAGLSSNVSPQSQEWFKCRASDPAIMEIDEVKQWWDTATNKLADVLQRSNFYQAAPTVYFDQGIFGTAACDCQEDVQDVVRFYVHPVGSYAIAQDAKCRVNILVREYKWSLRQVIEKYGDANLSAAMQAAARDGKKLDSTKVEIREAVYPNDEYFANSLRAEHKRFAYCVWEKSGPIGGTEKFLFEGGFDEFPFLVPRWALRDASTPYGSSPGMESLGDNKMLQRMTKDGLKALAKEIDPPLTGPGSLEGKKKSLLPGDFTADDATDEKRGLRPIHETRVNFANLLEWRRDTREQVKGAFHVPLFLMLTQDARSQPPTAEEIRARYAEKVMALGPGLARQNDDWLKPCIERVMAIMIRRSLMAWKLGMDGLLPLPPPAMRGKDWQPEFISALAGAQRAASTANTENFVNFVVQKASEMQDPSMLDPIDFPETWKVLAESGGVPEKVLRSDAAVAAIRAGRAQAQAAAQAQASAPGMAKAALDASNTDPNKDSLLNRVLRHAGAS